MTNSECSRLVSRLGNILFQISKNAAFFSSGYFINGPAEKLETLQFKTGRDAIRYHKNI